MENSNLTAEVNTSQRAKEVADTVIITNRSGYGETVINMDSPKYAPFEGIVELIPVRQAKGVVGQNGTVPFRHKAEVSWSVVTDKATQMKIGVHNGFDPKTGEIRWQKNVLRDIEFLDLSVPAQRRKYICIKYGPFLQGSPNFVNTSKTVYREVDKEKEASQFMLNRRRKQDAAKIADSLYGEELKEIGLLLGFDPKFMSETTLQMEVIRYVDNDAKVNGKTGAERFLEVYNSDFKNENIILRRGMATGIVFENPNGIIFNGITIGYTEDEAVKYLKNNVATANSIDIQSRTKNSQSKSSVVGSEKVKTEAQLTDKEFYEKQIAELRKQLAEKQETVPSGDEDEGEKAILDALILEAKEVGVKSPHLLGGKNKTFAQKVEILNDAIQKQRMG